jgi:hypothetical protein
MLTQQLHIHLNLSRLHISHPRQQYKVHILNKGHTTSRHRINKTLTRHKLRIPNKANILSKVLGTGTKMAINMAPIQAYKVHSKATRLSMVSLLPTTSTIQIKPGTVTTNRMDMVHNPPKHTRKRHHTRNL